MNAGTRCKCLTHLRRVTGSARVAVPTRRPAREDATVILSPKLPQDVDLFRNVRYTAVDFVCSLKGGQKNLSCVLTHCYPQGNA